MIRWLTHPYITVDLLNLLSEQLGLARVKKHFATSAAGYTVSLVVAIAGHLPSWLGEHFIFISSLEAHQHGASNCL